MRATDRVGVVHNSYLQLRRVSSNRRRPKGIAGWLDMYSELILQSAWRHDSVVLFFI